jgi:hypothetical protein
MKPKIKAGLPHNVDAMIPSTDDKKPEPIYVTRPELPSLKAFIPHLRRIWDSKILTNGGPFHQEFERALREYLGVKQIALFTNGTIGACSITAICRC